MSSAAVLLLASGCGSGGSAGGDTGITSDSITVGIDVARTGVGASVCSPMVDGINAWFKHVNDAGGVNGRKIKTIVLDDGYLPARASTNAKTLVSDHVATVMGACGMIIVPALLPPLMAAKIPFLFPQAALGAMVNPVQPYAYALLPLYGDQMAALIKYAFAHNGPGTVAIINDTVPGVDQTVSQIEGAVKAGGGSTLMSLTVPPNTADLSPYALKVSAQKPDYVVMDMTAVDAARVATLWQNQKFLPNKLFLSPSMLTQAQFLESTPIINDRMLQLSVTAPPGSPEVSDCASVLQPANISLTAYPFWGCGVAQIYVKILQNLGKNVTRAGIVKQLDSWQGVNASAVFQPITFTTSNHMGTTKMFLVGVKDNKNYIMPDQFVTVGG